MSLRGLPASHASVPTAPDEPLQSHDTNNGGHVTPGNAAKILFPSSTSVVMKSDNDLSVARIRLHFLELFRSHLSCWELLLLPEPPESRSKSQQVGQKLDQRVWAQQGAQPIMIVSSQI